MIGALIALVVAIAAVAIAVVGWRAIWLLGVLNISMGAGILGLLVALVDSAVVLIAAAKVVPGFETHGFTGALIASVASAVYWLINWLLTTMMGG
jgi:uncharacterized membrane protein YvlD (DUF360 family)